MARQKPREGLVLTCLLPQVDPEILKINKDYNNSAKELRKKLGLPALAAAAAVVAKHTMRRSKAIQQMR
jgi:hypothetical protein